MKRTLAALTCTVALVAGLTACSGDNSRTTVPKYTGTSSPSTTATSRPPTTAQPKEAGPVVLVAHSTYTYGGLRLVVNLPGDIPAASLPSMRVFSEFLQADGRMMARNKVDPAVSRLASASVQKYVQSTVVPGSVEGIGSVIFTVNKIQTGTSGFSTIIGCTDQSKLVQVRKDGSRFASADIKKYPTLKMTADVTPGLRGRQVTSFRFAVGSC